MSRFSAALVLSLSVSAIAPSMSAQSLPAQTARPKATLAAGGSPADAAKEPKLEHFDPNLVDKTLDPCNDFYKYSCSKWLTANPIPADQVYWSTGSGLEMWNENVLRETLEAASKNDATAVRSSRRLATTGPPAWTRAASKLPDSSLCSRNSSASRRSSRKKEITLEIARLHHLFPGAWQYGRQPDQFAILRLHRASRITTTPRWSWRRSIRAA